MSQPVWTLSVDLQTKTATFTSGLADAAKGARSSFQDIKSGADDMGRGVSGSMTEARHGVMLLGEEFGVRLPRALTSFIASIGPVGAAMEAAFPFLAIIVGATLLLQHLAKIREEGGKLTESQLNFGTTVTNVLNGLNDKLLQAGIRADELNHNHLGALNKQLELIDHTSMNELVQAFGVVSKAADVTFAQLKSSWYQWGAGSAGAKNALEQFKSQYESLISQGKSAEANDLLAGTRKSAERVLELQKQANDVSQSAPTKGGGHSKQYEAQLTLQKEGIGFTKKELEAQEILNGALDAQVSIQAKVNELKAAQKTNAIQSTDKSIGADEDKQARTAAEAFARGEEDKEKIAKEAYDRAVSQIQENERLKIDATKEGSSARLQAIDAAIKDEEAHGLQETGFYKSLLRSQTDAARQFDDEQKKLKAEAGKEEAEQTLKMGELDNAAKRGQAQLSMSALKNSLQERIAEEQRFANEDFALKSQANAQELAALEKTDKDYENRVKALNDKQLLLTKQHENELTAVTIKAEEERNSRVVSAQLRADDEVARSMTGLLMRKESISKTMISLGDQVMAGLMQNAIQSILTNNMTKESDAAAAARKAFLAGEKTIPGVPGVLLGSALAAMAFTSVLAFQSGGIVPGVGTGDTVPAMLEPGEGVLSNKVMDRLSNISKFGNDNGGAQEIHVHHHATYHVQAFNSDGVDQVLRDHGDKFVNHAANQLRKMNR